MRFIDKIKRQWSDLHTWVKIVAIILVFLIIFAALYFIANLIVKWLFGFGNWIGRVLKIPGY